MSVAPDFKFWVPIVGILLPLIPQLLLAGPLDETEIRFGDGRYRVELAITAEQRRQGLMGRLELPRDRGMLLVYPRTGDHRIWMKNMQFALRVYWIDSDFRVIQALRLEPCRADPCTVYAAPSASRYVLELGDHEHALQFGDRVGGISHLR